MILNECNNGRQKETERRSPTDRPCPNVGQRDKERGRCWG